MNTKSFLAFWTPPFLPKALICFQCLCGIADQLILKYKSFKCRMTYFGRTSCTFVKCQADRKDIIKPWKKSPDLKTNKMRKFTLLLKRWHLWNSCVVSDKKQETINMVVLTQITSKNEIQLFTYLRPKNIIDSKIQKETFKISNIILINVFKSHRSTRLWVIINYSVYGKCVYF